MLRIPNLEELKTLLLELPGVVDDVEQRDHLGAYDRARAWLHAVEAALESNRMIEAAEFAGLRSQLAMGRLGSVPAGVTVRDRTTDGKTRRIAYLEVLRLAGPLLASTISSDMTTYGEADRVARQLVTAARVKGIISAQPSGADRPSAVRAIWAAIEADPEIAQGAVHIVSLLGPDDTLLLVEHAISRDIWK